MIEPRNATLAVHTPEGVEFSLLLAGPSARFLAWGIDFGVTLAVALIVLTTFSIMQPIFGDLSTAISILTFFVLNTGYNILLEWIWHGQTLGKFLLKIRVMDAQGLRLQFSQIVMRNLMRTVDMLPMLYLAGGAAMLFSRHAQRLGDLAANTVVVHTPAPKQPDLQQLLPGKYNSFREYPHWEARLRQRVSPVEVALLVQALMRRNELDPDARVALYGELAGHFKELVAFPEEATAGLTDEQYLRNTVDSIFRKSGV